MLGESSKCGHRKIPAHPHPQEDPCPLAQPCMSPAPGVALHIPCPRVTPGPWCSPTCPQPQQDHQPPAHLSAPHRVIYRLCTGRQMVKENRAGDPASRGLPVPCRGQRGRLLTASRVGGSEVVLVPGSTAAPVMVQQPQALEALGEPMVGGTQTPGAIPQAAVLQAEAFGHGTLRNMMPPHSTDHLAGVFVIYQLHSMATVSALASLQDFPQHPSLAVELLDSGDCSWHCQVSQPDPQQPWGCLPRARSCPPRVFAA